jgi:Ulp1 family protease
VWSRSVEGDRGDGNGVSDARVWMADSLFYKRLEQEPDISKLSAWFRGLGTLESMDRIVMPIHIPSHWITVVIHVRERIVHVEDPLGGVHDDIALKIREWLEWIERRDSRGRDEQEEPDAWEYRIQGRVRQTNGVDCGVFCVADMICAGEGREPVLSQTGAGRMRQWLAQQWWLSGQQE